MRVIVNAEVTRLHGDDRVTGAEIAVRGGAAETLPVDTVVAALGFTADLGPLAEWGLRLDRRHIVVDSAMATNLPRVFAAGDITEYPGKVRLIATGFGEAATAVNNAAVAIDPTAHLFPGPLLRRRLTEGPRSRPTAPWSGPRAGRPIRSAIRPVWWSKYGVPVRQRPVEPAEEFEADQPEELGPAGHAAGQQGRGQAGAETGGDLGEVRRRRRGQLVVGVG